MLHKLESVTPGDGNVRSVSVNVVPREEAAGAAIGLAAALSLGILLGVALGLKMELGKERVAHRLSGYRVVWQGLRGTLDQ